MGLGLLNIQLLEKKQESSKVFSPPPTTFENRKSLESLVTVRFVKKNEVETRAGGEALLCVRDLIVRRISLEYGRSYLRSINCECVESSL